jgi:hypothetical protein
MRFSSLSCYTSLPSHSPWFDQPINNWWWLRSFLLCIIHQPPVTSCLLCSMRNNFWVYFYSEDFILEMISWRYNFSVYFIVELVTILIYFVILCPSVCFISKAFPWYWLGLLYADYNFVSVTVLYAKLS